MNDRGREPAHAILDRAQRDVSPLVEDRLCAALPIIGEVTQREHHTGGGIAVDIFLDPQMCRARALQQGLSDDTVSAASRSARVQTAIDIAVQDLNMTLPRWAQIVHYRIRT
jgi:hypothetical protein